MPTQLIERPVARDSGEPGAGAARGSVPRPHPQRLGEGVLCAFFGEVPVAGHADQRRDDPAPLGAEGLVNCRGDVGCHGCQKGRTSIDPNAATGCFAATSIAWSRSAHSMMSNPAICSLVSANGPSDNTTSASLTRTVVASLTAESWSPVKRMPRPSISVTHASVAAGTSARCAWLSSTDSSAHTSIMYFIVSSVVPSSRDGALSCPAYRRFATTTNGTARDGHLRRGLCAYVGLRRRAAGS